jgi:hypothetical protein
MLSPELKSPNAAAATMRHGRSRTITFGFV